MKGATNKPSKERIYQLIIAILTTGLILSIVGWIQANNLATQGNDIKERLSACQNVEEGTDEYDICSDAIDDLRAEFSVYAELLRSTGIN